MVQDLVSSTSSSWRTAAPAERGDTIRQLWLGRDTMGWICKSCLFVICATGSEQIAPHIPGEETKQIQSKNENYHP